MNYKNVILNKLIDKYENSKNFGEDTLKQAPRISCRDMINAEEYRQAEQFKSDVLELAEKNFVSYIWERKDCLIDKVILHIDSVDAIYSFLGRKSKKSQINDVLSAIESSVKLIETDWIYVYLSEEYNNIKIKNTLSGIWKKDIELVRNILKSLVEISRFREQSVAMRVFSIRLYRDSKYFEKNIKDYIINITEKYEPELCNMDELSEREILHHVGIITIPEVFEFCGNIVLEFSDGVVNFSPIKSGSCISGNCIDEIKSVEIKGIKRIIFIENKTNYSEYCLKVKKSDEFVIYHGGFYSPQKKKFFEIIYQSAKEIPIYFWADIDYGGFKMFMRLKNNIISELMPMNMTAEYHKKYSEKLLARSDSYIKKLLALCNDKQYSIFYDTIQAIAESHGTVEQESFFD